MPVQSESLALGEKGQAKSAGPTVDFASVSDRDALDREQLARLGKKSVLKARVPTSRSLDLSTSLAT